MHVLTPVRNVSVRGLRGSVPDDSAHDVRAVALSQRRVTNQLVADSTPVTRGHQDAPVQTPGQRCSASWNTWKASYPQQARCAGDSVGAAKFLEICTRVVAGSLTNSAGQERWADYVQARCNPDAPPPRTRPPVPPPTTSDPNPGGGSPGGGGDPSAGGGPGGGGDAEETGARALLRQVGPVVGLGLLLAIGLTVARKRKLTRRR